jgi:hypothetical protein
MQKKIILSFILAFTFLVSAHSSSTTVTAAVAALHSRERVVEEHNKEYHIEGNFIENDKSDECYYTFKKDKSSKLGYRVYENHVHRIFYSCGEHIYNSSVEAIELPQNERALKMIEEHKLGDRVILFVGLVSLGMIFSLVIADGVYTKRCKKKLSRKL